MFLFGVDLCSKITIILTHSLLSKNKLYIHEYDEKIAFSIKKFKLAVRKKSNEKTKRKRREENLCVFVFFCVWVIYFKLKNFNFRSIKSWCITSHMQNDSEFRRRMSDFYSILSKNNRNRFSNQAILLI